MYNILLIVVFYHLLQFNSNSLKQNHFSVFVFCEYLPKKYIALLLITSLSVQFGTLDIYYLFRSVLCILKFCCFKFFQTENIVSQNLFLENSMNKKAPILAFYQIIKYAKNIISFVMTIYENMRN